MEEAPISFYLKLEQGQHADLKVVSQAGIAFANLVERIASTIDPFEEVHLEIINGSEGSFEFNAVIKAVKNAYAGIQAGLEKKPALKWLVVYVVFRIANHGVDWTQDQVFDWLIGKDAPKEAHHMSKQELQELAGQIAIRLKPELAKAESETLYSILRRDSKIVGVGVSAIHDKKPEIIVPQTEFQERAGQAPTNDLETRTRTERLDVVLISPVLMDSDRRWKFSGPHGEFGAPMKDKQFLTNALSGRADIRLRQGLHMDVLVEVTESSQDGVWRPEFRTVTRVYGWKEPPEQVDLFTPGPDDIQPSQ